MVWSCRYDFQDFFMCGICTTCWVFSNTAFADKEKENVQVAAQRECGLVGFLLKLPLATYWLRIGLTLLCDLE